MLRPTLDTFLIVTIICSFAGSSWAGCPDGDLQNDCRVDFRDVKFLADHWLDGPGSPATSSPKTEWIWRISP